MKQKSIKLIASLLALISLAVFLPGCEKDSDDQDPIPATIEGLWVGTYTVDGMPNLGQQYYSLVIKPDGTVINDTKGANQQNLHIGNWTLTGNSFSTTVTSVWGSPYTVGTIQTHTATFDKANGTVTNGVWMDVDAPPNYSGTFTMTKVK